MTNHPMEKRVDGISVIQWLSEERCVVPLHPLLEKGKIFLLPFKGRSGGI